MFSINQPRATLKPTPTGLADLAQELRAGRVGVLGSASRQDLPAWRSILDTGEQARAERFLVARAFEEFVLGRMLLRMGLAAFLGGLPQSFEISTPPSGKPCLLNGPNGFDFNITHSGGAAACAFHAYGSVGIDMEAGHNGLDVDALASRILCAQEAEVFSRLNEPERSSFFFEVWRCKEAVAKAAGLGLRADFRQFTTHDTHGHLKRVELNETVWNLHALNDGPCGALAIAFAQSA